MPDVSPAAGTPAETGAEAALPIHRGLNGYFSLRSLRGLGIGRRTDGRKNTPLSWLTPAMASLGVSWAGRLRVRHSHGGLASGRASETRGCPLAGRDLHGNPLHTDLCFWRLLLALCAIATPEAVLGECCYVSGLSRDAGSIGELRRRTGRSMHALRRAVANAFPSARFIEFARVVKCNRICPSGQVKLCLS